MTKADALRTVIERLEKASGPDRALDCRIWLALFDKQIMVDGGGYRPNASPPKYESARKIWNDEWPHWGERSQVEHGVAMELGCPRYTESIDAAVRLVPEGLFWVLALGKCRPDEPLGAAQIIAPVSEIVVAEAEAETPAIALSLAALKARARQENEHGE